MTAWRAALRLARRDALRHRWRSLLIVVLILTPVAAATGVDILYRTKTSVELERERSFGGADAIVRAGLDQASTLYPTQRQVEAVLAPGARAIYERYETEDVFTAPGHVAQSTVRISDHLGDPLLRAEVELTDGRFPTAAPEVAISRKLADRLGIDGIGSTLGMRGQDITVTVTGIVRDPFCLSCPLLTARTDSVIAQAADATLPANVDATGAYYVTLPDYDDGLSALRGLFSDNTNGGSVSGRYDYSDYQIGLTDLSRAGSEDIKAAALVTLVAGLGLLEVVLLAGTAFAVGARRQTRDLGMIAAQGGSPRDLRRVVLAQGLLLGAVGAVAGVAAGFAAIVTTRPITERIDNEVMVGVHYGIAEIVVVAAVGLFSGLAAALVPAVGASRRRPIDALAARFPVPTSRSTWAPVFGALLIAAGTGVSLVASYLMSHGGGSGGGFVFGPIEQYNALTERGRLDDTTGSIAILVGVFVVVGGLLLLTPALLAALAKLAGRMPATMRLATRDAARHRHRTGPATAAIAVAVGGAVAISCLIASDREGTERFEADAMPDRVISLSTQGAVDPSQLGPATEAVRRVIPGATVLQVDAPLSARDTSGVDSYYSPMQVRAVGGRIGGVVGVGDADLVVLASGRVADREAAAAALDAGKVVVFDAAAIAADGKVTVETGEYDAAGSEVRSVRLPAVALPQQTPYGQLPSAIMSADAARAQGWSTEPLATLVSYPASSRAEAGAAIQIAEQLGIPVISSAQERDVARLVRVGLAAGAALIALLGVAMCVALSGAEGRPDLATLSAIGAPPSRRRRLAGAQALVLGGLGSLLGLAFGFYFARAARPATGAAETVVPWSDLLVTVAAVPLLAVLVAYAGSVGRISLTRRAD